MAISDDIKSKIKERVADACVIDEEEWIANEISAYEELISTFSNDLLEESSFGADSYQSQLEFLKQKTLIGDVSKSIRTPEHLALLIELEHIVGSRCRNKNNEFRTCLHLRQTWII